MLEGMPLMERLFFITAVRQGQDAALTIDSDLRGTRPYKEFVGEFTEINPMRDKTYLRTKWALPFCAATKRADQEPKHGGK